MTNDKFFDRYPRWSPDGKRIVFTPDRSGSYEIWTLNAEDTGLRQITFGSESSASLPLWSPDGKQILFRRSFTNAIIDVDKDWAEQTPQPLPTPEGGRHFVSWDWSPDGKKLAGTFSGDRLSVGYFSLTDRRFEKLADTEIYPMWLSDSRRFVFSTESKVYIADIVTKRVREVFNTEEDQIRSVGISNDDRLLYFSIYESESDIWLLDLRQ